MTIRWLRGASHDLDELTDYVANDSPKAAARMADSILSAINLLKHHPEMGRKGRAPGTRELVIPPYIVAYRVRNRQVEILAVLHAARRWPDSF